ncbi:MAG: NACHT domain-containing protein, partial [Planctomycetes bacterium]|nr:NACHT domain-containing protein [Planctomycetota bacterium]
MRKIGEAELKRVLRVFVSSPGDVDEERAVLDEVAASINRTDGQSLGFVMELFKWEERVIPKIGPDPQQVVDDQTLTYDIYLGIMSTRYGGGGTIKEFQAALKKWRCQGTPWIMFYFNDAPPTLRKPKEIKEYLKVCTFREALESKGIVTGYTCVRGSRDGFFERASEHLRLLASELLNASTETAKHRRTAQKKKTAKKGGVLKKKGNTRPEIPGAYLQALKHQCEDVDLLGLRVQQGQTVKLNQVYVPLITLPDKESTLPREKDTERFLRGKDRPAPLLLDLLDEHSLYIAGAPGTGKSTFCRWVAWLACTGTMPEPYLKPAENYVERFPQSFSKRLPLLVRLREFWSHLPQTPSCREMTPAELEKILYAWVDAKDLGGLKSGVVKAHLKNGSLLLILDGMDEIPLTRGDQKHPFQPRATLLSALAASLKPWIRSGNRVILTSRPYGVNSQEAVRLPLRPAPIADLNPPLRELLIKQWFHCLTDPPAAAETKAQQMLTHITRRRDIEPLSVNPMLLTAMCILYQQGGRLPQDRYDLYNRMVDNVLFNRFPDDREVIDPVRNRLAVVAFGMHTGEGLGEERAAPQAEVTCSEIDTMIQKYQDQTPYTEPSYRGAVE